MATTGVIAFVMEEKFIKKERWSNGKKISGGGES